MIRFDRASLKSEYLRAINFLNTSNNLANEKTKAHFFIDAEEKNLFLALNKNQKLLLSQKNSNDCWIGYPKNAFPNLGQFCANYATYNPYDESFSDDLISAIFNSIP